MNRHRYSGWPGAWCLDCGQEDPWEAAIAGCDYDPYAEAWRSEQARLFWEPHINRPCPCPGTGNCDPYRRPAAAALGEA